jgi:hypothetical protein
MKRQEKEKIFMFKYVSVKAKGCFISGLALVVA